MHDFDITESGCSNIKVKRMNLLWQLGKPKYPKMQVSHCRPVINSLHLHVPLLASQMVPGTVPSLLHRHSRIII